MRILYLYPFSLYSRKMSVGRALYGEAVGRQPGIELEFWGEDWPGYDNCSTLCENIRRSGKSWEVCWFYKAAGIIRPEQFRGLKVIAFNEAHHHKTLEEIRDADANLVLFHHANDIRRWPMLDRDEGRMVGYLPHGADPGFFQPLPWESRDIDCLFTGVSAPVVYPMRERLKLLVKGGQIKGEIRPHPGYRLNGHDAIRQQYADYAAHLGRAKIALACCSRHSYALAKCTEALLAGCVLCTDCPDDDRFREKLWPHCIQVDMRMSDKELARVINEHLSHPEGLKRMAEAGRAAVLAGWTTEHYAKQFVGWCERAIAERAAKK